jgi:inner membrane protein
MPTILSHAILASALGSAFQSQHEKLPTRFWILTVICSMLPDLDAVGFAFGVQYSSMFGHRGITHSLFFSILLGVIVSILFFPASPISRWKAGLYFAGVTLTHPLLDMLTNGGLGVALLAPLTNERFFFPWRPIEVSPIGTGFFSERGLAVITNEAFWIFMPSILIVLAFWFIRAKTARAGSP